FRVIAVGGTAHSTSASKRSLNPTPVLAEQHTIGINVPAATARTISASSCSAVGSSPSKYFIISSSSTSIIDSMRDVWISLGLTSAPATLPGGFNVLATP